MTEKEALGVLAIFASAYQKEIEEPTVEVWVQCLQPIQKEDGLRTARMIVENQKKMPVPAEFLEVASGIRKGREAAEAARRPQLESPPPNKELGKAWHRHTAAKLRGDKKHRAAAPEKCAACKKASA